MKEKKKYKIFITRNESRIQQLTNIQGVQEYAEKNPRKDWEKEKSLKLS
jgi:hypothetical protein